MAVHPDDERYRDCVGKNVILPLVGREIPVVADSYVEMDFGTGVVKITPAHDPNDFEVGLRHHLPVITVTDEGGVMNAEAGRYEGLSLSECRKAIVKDLEDGGFLIKIEPLRHRDRAAGVHPVVRKDGAAGGARSGRGEKRRYEVRTRTL